MPPPPPECRKHCPLTQSLRPDTPHTYPRSQDQTDPLEPGWGGNGPQRDFMATLPSNVLQAASWTQNGKRLPQQAGGGGQGQGCTARSGSGGAGRHHPSSRSQQEGTAHAEQESFRLDPRQHFLEKGGLWRRSGGPGTAWGQGRQTSPGTCQWGPAFHEGGTQGPEQSQPEGEASRRPADVLGAGSQLGAQSTRPSGCWGPGGCRLGGAGPTGPLQAQELPGRGQASGAALWVGLARTERGSELSHPSGKPSVQTLQLPSQGEPRPPERL